MHEIVRVNLENEMDLILAHKRTMKLAELCGLSLPVQTTFATAVSEIARCAIDEGKEAYLLLAIEFLRGGRKEIQAIITDTSAFCTEQAEHLKYARRLIDDVVLESTPAVTRVILCHRINFSGTITEARILSFTEYFRTEPPISPYDEIRRKNTQLQSLADKFAESEKKFRQLADSLPHMLWTAAPDGTIDYFNKRWYEYAGTDGIQSWLPVVHPEDSPKAQETWGESLRTGAPWFAQNRLRDKRNASVYRWHEERGVAVRDDKGNIIKWFVSATDIDDQKRLEDKLRESEEYTRLANEELEKKVAVRTSELKRANQALEDKNRELERSNQELASFSYVASHDLQEPLRKIQAFTQRITEAGEFNDTTRDYFNRIRAGARRMQNLIDSLLDFSRVNTSKNIFESVDLNVLVQDVLLHLKDMVEEKAATVLVSMMPQASVIPVQFHQLLLNLISNALKYGKTNVPPIVRIEAERIKGISVVLADIDANKEYWAISIVDNGIGFEQQYEHKIFEIFQRLHGRHEYAGTGIGLAICKKIVQNHYGTIVATGVPDEGSVFTVYIPADH